jgi:hypothetical protein
MPNAMDIGFSFPTYVNILAEREPPNEKKNYDEHPEYSGSQTRRSHYNQPPDAVKDAADRIGRAMRRRS